MVGAEMQQMELGFGLPRIAAKRRVN